MFRKMPFILIAQSLLLWILFPLLPNGLKSILYGLSLTLKSGLIFALPALIFGLLFKTALQLSKNGSRWILILLGAICLSNFTSTMISYGVGSLAYQLDLSLPIPDAAQSLDPIGAVELPKWIGNGTAMLSGLVLGLFFGRHWPARGEKIGSLLDRSIARFLKSFLVLLPLFIAGFVVKMMHDETIGLILRNYALIFALVAGAVFSYIALIYLSANGFRRRPFVQSVQNMLPAAMVGFGSMSSAAAMPLTILAAEKNGRDPNMARSIIPATVNIHLIGDCFAIPIFAFAILKSFGLPEPAFASYLIFASYFVVAKFSVAAVPGGGILVMLPILEAYLGFNGEMLSLITALYILFDPVITAANVFGNGGFAMGLQNFFIL